MSAKESLEQILERLDPEAAKALRDVLSKVPERSELELLAREIDEYRGDFLRGLAIEFLRLIKRIARLERAFDARIRSLAREATDTHIKVTLLEERVEKLEKKLKEKR